MAFLTEAEVRRTAVFKADTLARADSQALTAASPDATFDVFLSHSSNEPAAILDGIRRILHQYGLTVYVDKFDDPQLSPLNVTKDTAEAIRNRMRRSNTLLYVYSRHSTRSRWMPWELGYFDGLKGRVGVLPVTQDQEEEFKGEEFLNLYPYVDRETMKGSSRTALWINESRGRYANLAKWSRLEESIRPHS